MSYLAIYRRYRPTDFSRVIGQEPIVKTLVNQIMTDKVGHAYLFCGARGVGKTTLAKIFAKSVNCEHPVNGSPCGECPSCKSLQETMDMNIIEMDAASNNGVDNIRSLIDSIQFAPIGVKYKVYIIDEVHMLSSGAFNALLKTLEEPPKHAIFILATTEPHKIPETILSRCMRFDFKLVPTSEIASLIGKIYDELGVKYEKEAILEIAKAGDGSVRDALSIADLCISIGDGILKYTDVLAVTGATDLAKSLGVISNMFTGSVGGVLSLTEEILNSGKSIGLLAKEIVNCLRDISIVKACNEPNKILNLPNERLQNLIDVAAQTDNHKLFRTLEIMSLVESDIRYSTQPRAILETALIKASIPEVDYNIDSLIGRINKLEEEIKELKQNGVVVKQVQPVQDIKPQPIKEETKANEVKKEQPELDVIDNIPVEDNEVEPYESYEEYIPDEGDYFPPIEDEYIPQDEVKPQEKIIKQDTLKSIEEKIEQIEKKEEQKVEVINEIPEGTVNAPIERIWGTLLRKSRVSDTGTWFILQNLKGIIKGSMLVIDVLGDDNKIKDLKDKVPSLLSIVQPFGVTKIGFESNKEVDIVGEKIKDVVGFFNGEVEIKE